jgi:hypothetical protein
VACNVTVIAVSSSVATDCAVASGRSFTALTLTRNCCVYASCPDASTPPSSPQ